MRFEKQSRFGKGGVALSLAGWCFHLTGIGPRGRLLEKLLPTAAVLSYKQKLIKSSPRGNEKGSFNVNKPAVPPS